MLMAKTYSFLVMCNFSYSRGRFPGALLWCLWKLRTINRMNCGKWNTTIAATTLNTS